MNAALKMSISPKDYLIGEETSLVRYLKSLDLTLSFEDIYENISF